MKEARGKHKKDQVSVTETYQLLDDVDMKDITMLSYQLSSGEEEEAPDVIPETAASEEKIKDLYNQVTELVHTEKRGKTHNIKF